MAQLFYLFGWNSIIPYESRTNNPIDIPDRLVVDKEALFKTIRDT